MKSLFPAVLVLTLATPALGAEPDPSDRYTGNYMLPHCRDLVHDDDATTPLAGFCAGVIATLFWSQPIVSG
jgi:hypothetical protein